MATEKNTTAAYINHDAHESENCGSAGTGYITSIIDPLHCLDRPIDSTLSSQSPVNPLPEIHRASEAPAPSSPAKTESSVVNTHAIMNEKSHKAPAANNWLALQMYGLTSHVPAINIAQNITGVQGQQPQLWMHNPQRSLTNMYYVSHGVMPPCLPPSIPVSDNTTTQMSFQNGPTESSSRHPIPTPVSAVRHNSSKTTPDGERPSNTTTASLASTTDEVQKRLKRNREYSRKSRLRRKLREEYLERKISLLEKELRCLVEAVRANLPPNEASCVLNEALKAPTIATEDSGDNIGKCENGGKLESENDAVGICG